MSTHVHEYDYHCDQDCMGWGGCPGHTCTIRYQDTADTVSIRRHGGELPERVDWYGYWEFKRLIAELDSTWWGREMIDKAVAAREEN